MIGDEFDGYSDRLTPAPCESLSYETCAQFVRAFEKLYGGRDKTKYILDNPMRRSAATPIPSGGSVTDAFENAQFPIRYNFVQDKTTGVVTREFTTVTTMYFYLTNPSSGKVLGIRGNDCDSGFIEVQDQSGSDYQKWLSDSSGKLKNKGCNKYLTNRHLTCSAGNELALDLAGDQFTFYKDGRIINKRCKCLE